MSVRSSARRLVVCTSVRSCARKNNVIIIGIWVGRGGWGGLMTVSFGILNTLLMLCSQLSLGTSSMLLVYQWVWRQSLGPAAFHFLHELQGLLQRCEVNCWSCKALKMRLVFSVLTKSKNKDIESYGRKKNERLRDAEKTRWSTHMHTTSQFEMRCFRCGEHREHLPPELAPRLGIESKGILLEVITLVPFCKVYISGLIFLNPKMFAAWKKTSLSWKSNCFVTEMAFLLVSLVSFSSPVLRQILEDAPSHKRAGNRAGKSRVQTHELPLIYINWLLYD